VAGIGIGGLGFSTEGWRVKRWISRVLRFTSTISRKGNIVY
jgi:hypothetical protein